MGELRSGSHSRIQNNAVHRRNTAQRHGVAAVMAEPRTSPASIDRVLSEVDARVRQQHRVSLEPGEVLAIRSGEATLVYVIDGGLCTAVQGAAAGGPIGLAAGDARLFTGRDAHSLISGGAFVLVSTFDFSASGAGVLELLPGTVTAIDLRRSAPAVAALAAQLGRERSSAEPAPMLCDEMPGSTLICEMMAKTVLVSVIQSWVVGGCAPLGWPSRTDDPHLDRVVEAMHAEPGRDWTVEDLARTGAMSRSVFAERFRAAMGTSPAEYLAGVRIRQAQQLLARGLGVSEVSRAIGYGSDDGFSRAFRRRVGTSPSTWRTALRAPAA